MSVCCGPAGLATTIGLVFSPVNVKLSAGLDQTACGLSTAMIGFFVNLSVTVVLGLLLEHRPQLAGKAFNAVTSMMPDYNHINIGHVRDTMLNPYLWAAMVTVLLFTVPFYRVPLSPDAFVGDMAAWAFVALMLSGVLAILVSIGYTCLWTSYQPEQLPSKDTDLAPGSGSQHQAGLELPPVNTASNKDTAAGQAN